MRKYIIERVMPQVGSQAAHELSGAAQHSNDVLGRLGPGIQWLETFVTDDKLFCVYLADSERKIREHAEQSGFPASAIHEVRRVLDPSDGERTS